MNRDGADKDEEALGAFVEKQTEPLGDDPYGEKPRLGRPAIEANDRDREIVFRMASRMMPQVDIAKALGISTHTLKKLYAREIELADLGCKESLRASQLRKAHRGSDHQLKWLGMQYLGQKDKVEADVTNRDFVIDDNDGKTSAEPPLEPDDNED